MSKEVQAMDGGIQIQKQILTPLWIRSRVAKTQQWTGSLVNRVVSLFRGTNISHLSVQQAYDMIPPLGIIMGAAAFGFWCHSILAGLFACCGLFFLAGIYKAMQRIVAVVLRWERDRTVGANPNRNASTSAEPSQTNIDALAGAIERLKPWVADEIALTEENVRASCAVFLECVAPSYRK